MKNITNSHILLFIFLYYSMITIINKILWSIAIAIIFYTGIYFTYYLKGIQFNIKKMFISLREKENIELSSLKVFMMTLAGKIGVGSIGGIAIAIQLGGIGSIFWIWVTSLIVSSNTFLESILAMKYKEKKESSFQGGPSYYIDKGLKKKKLAKCYAILLLISYAFGFLTIQANTIAIAVTEIINIDKIIVAIILAIVTYSIVSKGLFSIASATEKIVTIMGGIYFIIGCYVIIKNYTILPNLLHSIVEEAFSFKSAQYGMFSGIIVGIQRGIFSTEAGIGTSAIAVGASYSNKMNKNGFMQVLGVYFTTFFICTMTAIIIITSNYTQESLEVINGIELTQYAFSYHLNEFGVIILTIIIFLFAFSTIITIYYYGESNLSYLFPKISKGKMKIFKIILTGLIIYGCIAKANILWQIIDIFVALLAMMNTYAIYKLKDKVKR